MAAPDGEKLGRGVRILRFFCHEILVSAVIRSREVILFDQHHFACLFSVSLLQDSDIHATRLRGHVDTDSMAACCLMFIVENTVNQLGLLYEARRDGLMPFLRSLVLRFPILWDMGNQIPIV